MTIKGDAGRVEFPWSDQYGPRTLRSLVSRQIVRFLMSAVRSHLTHTHNGDETKIGAFGFITRFPSTVII